MSAADRGCRAEGGRCDAADCHQGRGCPEPEHPMTLDDLICAVLFVALFAGLVFSSHIYHWIMQ